MDEWEVNIKGEAGGPFWEISVVKKSNEHGHRSYGWFEDGKKLLVSHNGGPCHWPICGFVFDENVKIAHELCRRMNAGEPVDA